MTELEERLTKQLELQQDAFIAELERLSTEHSAVFNSQIKILEKQTSIIEDQRSLLEKYEKALTEYNEASTNISVNINDEELSKSLEKLEARLVEQDELLQTFNTRLREQEELTTAYNKRLQEWIEQ